MALDGVDEFLSTCCAATSAWPHEAAAVDYHATEGRSWRLSLSADGARITRLPSPVTNSGEGSEAAAAAARGTAGELVLTLYGRIPVDSLKLDGDRRLFEHRDGAERVMREHVRRSHQALMAGMDERQQES